jgi:glycosyltransferase involved in cell wall biosynthesis
MNSNLTAYFFSVTADLDDDVNELVAKFGNRVEFSTTRDPISHEKLSQIFKVSRIYVGCSISDGISTSFLESLAKGVYPIQTNTSCAEEWVKKGAIASLIDLNAEQLESALNFAISDDNAVDFAGIKNMEMAKELLSTSKITPFALEFYKPGV